MQKEIRIKTDDGHIIYGIKDWSLESDTILIFVHGLTGDPNEHQYFNAASFFKQKGFHVFRFGFYSNNEKARQISECSLAMHIDDLNKVIKYFKKKYLKIILVGHSLGALVVLRADLSHVNKIVLWDPTIGFKKMEDKKAFYCKSLNKYILRRGKETLVSKKLMEEWKDINLETLAEGIKIPCKMIFAGKNVNHKVWRQALKKNQNIDDVAIVKNASHCFTEEGAEKELFGETLSWIK